MAKAKWFPQHLNAPIQVLWFESDEVAVFFFLLTFALLFGSVFWYPLFIVPYAYRKFKEKYPRGFLKHCLYFIGLMELTGYPSFFEKEFLE